MNTTTVSTYGSSSPVPAPSPMPLPGAGSTLKETAAPGGTHAPEPAQVRADGEARAAAAAHQAPAQAKVVVPLDTFGKQGGPDAAVETGGGGMVQVHAVFQMDPTTRELTVSVVDADGRLIRMIPPDSVARMLAAMATYRGR